MFWIIVKIRKKSLTKIHKVWKLYAMFNFVITNVFFNVFFNRCIFYLYKDVFCTQVFSRSASANSTLAPTNFKSRKILYITNFLQTNINLPKTNIFHKITKSYMYRNWTFTAVLRSLFKFCVSKFSPQSLKTVIQKGVLKVVAAYI